MIWTISIDGRAVASARGLADAYRTLPLLTRGLARLEADAGDERVVLERFTWLVSPAFSCPGLPEVRP